MYNVTFTLVKVECKIPYAPAQIKEKMQKNEKKHKKLKISATIADFS